MLTEYEMGGTSVDGAGVKLDAPEAWKQAMRDMKPGRVIVRCELKRDTRSSQANRYYFGAVLRAISEHTGYEVDELHAYFKKRFNPRHIELGGDEDVVGGSTRKLNTQQFTEYVERIRRFAASELGVVTEDPS